MCKKIEVYQFQAHLLGCDFDIGDDYSFGKFESKYGEL